jgi:hypothetical protein
VLVASGGLRAVGGLVAGQVTGLAAGVRLWFEVDLGERSDLGERGWLGERADQREQVGAR